MNHIRMFPVPICLQFLFLGSVWDDYANVHSCGCQVSASWYPLSVSCNHNWHVPPLCSHISTSRGINMPWKGPGEPEAGFLTQSQTTMKSILIPVPKISRMELCPAAAMAKRLPLNLPKAQLQLTRAETMSEMLEVRRSWWDMPTVLYSTYASEQERIAPAGAVGYISAPCYSDRCVDRFSFAALVVFARFGFYLMYNE